MDLDRPLSEIADGYRPDSQPSLDDLVARSRARRRTTVLISTLSVLVVAVGVAVAVPREGAARKAVLPGEPTPSPSAAGGCDLEPWNAMIDYVDFVVVHGQRMDGWMGDQTARPVVREGDLGEVVAHVTCNVTQVPPGQNVRTMHDGYSSSLPVGAPVYAVHGFDPRCRIAARVDGELRAYLAEGPTQRPYENAACSLMPGLDPGAAAGAPGDVTTAVPRAFVNTARLPDCGSVDLRGGSLDAGGRAARDCLLAAVADHGRAQLRVVYRTVEAGPLYRVLGVYGGGVMQYRSGSDAFSGHVAPGWSEEACTGVDEELRGTSCYPTK